MGVIGYCMTEVVGIGIYNPGATLTMPEGLFRDLLVAFAQAAREVQGADRSLDEIRLLGEKYGDESLGEKLVQWAKVGLSSVNPVDDFTKR